PLPTDRDLLLYPNELSNGGCRGSNPDERPNTHPIHRGLTEAAYAPRNGYPAGAHRRGIQNPDPYSSGDSAVACSIAKDVPESAPHREISFKPLF
ncbi:MAG: hypothetical protein KDH20_14895, partial [Rhodocyclaceae bacterium]|nr:hypothetical protein [Rhodocyclaceae bacterium]